MKLESLLGKRIASLRLEQDGRLLCIKLDDGIELQIYHCIARDHIVVDTDTNDSVELEWN